MNTTTAIILMVLSSFMAASGQLSLKIGSMKIKKNLASIIKNYAFLAGVFFYGLAAIIGIVALKGNELTILYPIASLNYVWVSLLSMKFLKEKMNLLKWSGIALIILGVVIIL